MSTPQRMIAYGTALGYATTVGGSYTTLAGCKNITPGSTKISPAKNSGLDNATEVHTFQAGWQDAGEASFMLYMTKAQYVALRAISDAGTEYFWKVTFAKVSGESSASFMTAPGFVTEHGVPEISIEDDNLIMLDVKIKLNDRWTFTQGS